VETVGVVRPEINDLSTYISSTEKKSVRHVLHLPSFQPSILDRKKIACFCAAIWRNKE